MPAAGILVGKGATIGNLFCTAPKILKLHETSLELIRIIERKKYTRGPTPCPGDSRAPPYRADNPQVYGVVVASLDK